MPLKGLENSDATTVSDETWPGEAGAAQVVLGEELGLTFLSNGPEGDEGTPVPGPASFSLTRLRHAGHISPTMSLHPAMQLYSLRQYACEGVTASGDATLIGETNMLGVTWTCSLIAKAAAALAAALRAWPAISRAALWFSSDCTDTAL